MSWDVDAAAGLFILEWVEAGGPALGAPNAPSFGSRLIDMGISPRSQVRRTYATEGFRAELRAPFDELAVG